MADIYLEGVKNATIQVDGLDKVSIPDLENALAVMVKWFPQPLYRPAVFMSAEHASILEGAWWRYEACKQLAGYIAERKNPKPKTETTDQTT